MSNNIPIKDTPISMATIMRVNTALNHLPPAVQEQLHPLALGNPLHRLVHLSLKIDEELHGDFIEGGEPIYDNPQAVEARFSQSIIESINQYLFEQQQQQQHPKP